MHLLLHLHLVIEIRKINCVALKTLPPVFGKLDKRLCSAAMAGNIWVSRAAALLPAAISSSSKIALGKQIM
jgi:hypothetical protein